MTRHATRSSCGLNRSIHCDAWVGCGVAVLGTVTCMYFLAWFISSPEGDPSPETSPSAIVVVALIALAGVLLCIAAVKPVGAAVVRVSVIAVALLALVGLVFRAPEATGTLSVGFVVLSFLVPALAYALVLPVAIIGRRDLRAAGTAMAGIAVAFLAAFVVQSVSEAKMWISLADLGGAFWTGMLAVLLLRARAAEERITTIPPESSERTPAGSSPTAR